MKILLTNPMGPRELIWPYLSACPKPTPIFLGSVSGISALQAKPFRKEVGQTPTRRSNGLHHQFTIKERTMNTLINRRMSPIHGTRYMETEHDRLVRELGNHAVSSEFNILGSPPKGMDPDILLLSNDGCQFIGDAKDSANESPKNKETVARIRKYIKAFSENMISGEILGGVIAICTNSLVAAYDWQLWLEDACFDYGIYWPNFRVERLRPYTYVIESDHIVAISHLCKQALVYMLHKLNSYSLHSDSSGLNQAMQYFRGH